MGRALGEVMFSVDLQRELVRVTCWRAVRVGFGVGAHVHVCYLYSM